MRYIVQVWTGSEWRNIGRQYVRRVWAEKRLDRWNKSAEGSSHRWKCQARRILTAAKGA